MSTNDLGFLKALRGIALVTDAALKESPPNIQHAIAENAALIADLDSMILLETESDQ